MSKAIFFVTRIAIQNGSCRLSRRGLLLCCCVYLGFETMGFKTYHNSPEASALVVTPSHNWLGICYEFVMPPPS